MSNKLQRLAPAWHGQIAQELIREFGEVNELSETARRRRLRLGFMFIFVKETGKADESIPHGTFGDWLEKNCPAIPRSTVGDYITEANSVCDLLKWQKSEIRNFEPHRLLLAKDENLSGADKQRKAKLLKIADQEGHFRAVTQYKQVELKDDATVARRGRRPGEGGASKEQRATHNEKEEAARIEAMETEMTETAKFIMENADDKNFGQSSAGHQRKLITALETGLAYLKRLAEARKGAK